MLFTLKALKQALQTQACGQRGHCIKTDKTCSRENLNSSLHMWTTNLGKTVLASPCYTGLAPNSLRLVLERVPHHQSQRGRGSWPNRYCKDLSAGASLITWQAASPTRAGIVWSILLRPQAFADLRVKWGQSYQGAAPSFPVSYFSHLRSFYSKWLCQASRKIYYSMLSDKYLQL